ncbi:site-2 protease family protein [bacterium]|nr:site-2 protease family protein [bacterium]
MALTFHEVAHGFVAKRLGDPTADERGRLTLNPLMHIDPFGTIIFPLMLWLFSSPIIFGWAKPVPVDPNYFRKPLKGMMWVGMAGPIANVVLAACGALLFRGFMAIMPAAALDSISTIMQFLLVFILVNMVLCVFNLIPIPPLDGSRILTGLLPRRLAISYLRLERYGFIILIALLYFGVFKRVVFPVAIGFVEVLIGFRLF